MSSFFHRHQKTIIWAVVIGFLISGVGLIGLNQSGVFDRTATTSDGRSRYAAQVNGLEISLEAADTAVSNLFTQYQNLYQQIGQDPSTLLLGADGALFRLRLQAEAVNALIGQAILHQEAEDRRIRAERRDVTAAFEAQYNALLEENNITEDVLRDYLVQQGRTLPEFQDAMRGSIEEQLVTEALRSDIVGAIEPSDEDLLGYLEANITRYDVPEEIRASHILVADLETATSVRAQLDEGANFAQSAQEYSTDASKDNGGDLGWFGRGRMVREFEEAAFALQVGEISLPVQSQFGYHIILLTDRKDAHTPTVDEIKDELRTDFIAEQETERFETWYEAERAASEVEIALPLVNAYLLQMDDRNLGLAEFERIRRAGTESDPYLSYYIGRIYEDKALDATRERVDLEGIEDPTEEDLARIEELRADQDDYEAETLAAYLAVLDDTTVDEAFLNRILVLDPSSATAKYILGKMIADRGDFLTAEAHFSDVIEKDPTHVQAYIASGDLAAGIGNHTKAASRYEEALEQRPGDVSVLLKLANAYLQLDRLDDVAALIEQIAAADPGNVRGLIVEGDLAHQRLRNAVEERETLLKAVDRTAEEDARLAELGASISEFYETAVARYRAARDVTSTVDLTVKTGHVQLLGGRLDEAEDEFRAAILRSPYTATAYKGLGEVLAERGQIEEAVENLRTALNRSFDDAQKTEIAQRIVELVPDDYVTRLRLAKLFASQYMLGPAIREYSAVLADVPGSIEAYLGIADAYRGRTDYATAVEYLGRGLLHTNVASERLDLYQAIVQTLTTQHGYTQPLPAEGLDALIELAKLRIARGELTAALDDLGRVLQTESAYRGDEVRALIIEAGGEVPDLPAESVGDLQTESATLSPDDDGSPDAAK